MPHKSPCVRWSLTPPFHPYQLLGGIFSVALSRRSLWVGITHHCTLWSPDFPQSKLRSSDSLVGMSIALRFVIPKGEGPLTFSAADLRCERHLPTGGDLDCDRGNRSERVRSRSGGSLVSQGVSNTETQNFQDFFRKFTSKLSQ